MRASGTSWVLAKEIHASTVTARKFVTRLLLDAPSDNNKLRLRNYLLSLYHQFRARLEPQANVRLALSGLSHKRRLTKPLKLQQQLQLRSPQLSELL